MGNQREIRQVYPRKGLGVIVPVRAGRGADLSHIIGTQERGAFYTYFHPSGEPVEFPNMDGPDLSSPPLPYDCVVIQSGGKMWCGYEEFVGWIEALAPYLEDTHFFVGDEVDYIDEFKVTGGELRYNRVHQGGWLPVDKFIDTLGLA